MRKMLLLVLAIALVTTGAGAAHGGIPSAHPASSPHRRSPLLAAPTVTAHRVSGDSPFDPGACGSQIDVPNDHGYEIDPSFALSPKGLVAAWQQDGGLGIVAAHSVGGATWTQSVPPALSICQPGTNPSLRVFEPHVVVDGAGTTFLLTGEYGIVPSVAVSTSPDGGATWSQPTTFTGGGMISNPAISVDGADPHATAITWISHAPPDAVWFARTTDDGATWSTPVPIRLTPPGELVANASMATLPNGTMVLVTTDFPDGDLPTAYGLPAANAPGASRKVDALRSTDGGATWSETPIASLSPQGFGPHDPAVGPDGSAYALVSDLAGSERVWKLFRSIDGAVWSQAATIRLRDDVFPWPSIAISSDGTIGVLYDDHRNDVPGDDALTTDVWLTLSRDGGVTWSDLHLGGPFDWNTAIGNSNDANDYEQLHEIGNDFGAVFALGGPSATEGSTDIFYARISF